MSPLGQLASIISAPNMQPLQVEFRIQDGSTMDKKNPQFLLQSRLLSSTNLMKPCVPFLPSFATLQQSITNENTEPQSSDPTQQKKSMKYVCQICSKEFSGKHLLKKHATIHEPPSVHSCTECNKTFPRKAALRRHELTHNSIRSHLCDICGKGKQFFR